MSLLILILSEIFFLIMSGLCLHMMSIFYTTTIKLYVFALFLFLLCLYLMISCVLIYRNRHKNV